VHVIGDYTRRVLSVALSTLVTLSSVRSLSLSLFRVTRHAIEGFGRVKHLSSIHNKLLFVDQQMNPTLI
jgi:hypothetical protein